MSELDTRIREAFAEDTPSAAIAQLIDEVAEAAKRAAEEADRAHKVAVDPTLPAGEIEAARRRMDEAKFAGERMAEADARLRDQLKVAQRRERDARRRAAYDAALAERDVVAARVAARWSELEREMVGLLTELAAVEQRVEAVNRALPSGVDPLLAAELVARGMNSFVGRFADKPSLIRSTKLPAFQFNERAPYAWPRPERSTIPRATGAALAEIVVPTPIHLFRDGVKLQQEIPAGRATVAADVAEAAIAAGLALRADDPKAEAFLAELKAGPNAQRLHLAQQRADVASGRVTAARLDLPSAKARAA